MAQAGVYCWTASGYNSPVSSLIETRPAILAARASIAVLVVGRESMLRETYAMLFQRAGYTAEDVELAGSGRRLKGSGFSLLVMDHTLSREERKLLVPAARQLSPGIKVIALHSSAKDCGADLVMDSREGATTILERVAALLDSNFPPA